MKSVRFDDELQAELEQAAQLCGESQSEFIRAAVRQRCKEVTGDTLDKRLADVVGSVASGKRSSSRRTGDAFRSILRRKYEQRRL